MMETDAEIQLEEARIKELNTSIDHLYVELQALELKRRIRSAEKCVEPGCTGVLLGQPGGGVKCTECSYWFCF
jgi:hypothetical protein